MIVVTIHSHTYIHATNRFDTNQIEHHFVPNKTKKHIVNIKRNENRIRLVSFYFVIVFLTLSFFFLPSHYHHHRNNRSINYDNLFSQVCRR